MAPVAARRETAMRFDLDAEREEDDIAVRPPIVREERAPEDRRLSMVMI
jgi:hypothetical protein